MRRKLRNQRGESFIETLAAMCIIALGLLILAGALVSAARVNKRAANETVQVALPLHPASYETETGRFVEVRDEDSGNTAKAPVTLYKVAPEGSGDDGKQTLYYYAADP